MSITVAQLVEKLQAKDQKAQVEFLVVKTDGEIVTADVGGQVKSIMKLLKLFGGK